MVVQIEGSPDEIARFLAITGTGGMVACVDAVPISQNVSTPAPLERYLTGWVQRKRTRGQSDWKRAESVMRRVVRECGWLTITDATPASLDRWLAMQRDDGASGRTLNKHLSVVSTFLRYVHSVDPGVCPINWAKGIERCDESDATEGSRFLSRDEFARLTAWQDAHAPWRADYCRFLAYTGLRRSDEKNLTRAMVHLDDGVPRLEITRRTKNRKPRMVPLHPDLLPVVKARMNGPANDLLWPERPNLRTLKRDCDRAKVDSDRVGWHSFRKLCGSMLAAAGVPLRVAQDILGHSTPVLTARVYQSIEHSDAAEQVSKLPSFGDLSAAARKKAPPARIFVDGRGNLADTEGVQAVSSTDDEYTHDEQDDCSPQERLCPPEQRAKGRSGERSSFRRTGPDDLRESLGHLSSAVEHRFCKAGSDPGTKPTPPPQAQALADLFEAVARVLRLEAPDGTDL